VAAMRQPPAAVAALQLVDVVMRYRPGLPPALRGVNLTVPVGHKLGVCGRTGEWICVHTPFLHTCLLCFSVGFVCVYSVLQGGCMVAYM
jgi:hypothetical protein